MVCVTVRSRSEDKAKFVVEALGKGFEKQTANLKVLMGGADSRAARESPESVPLSGSSRRTRKSRRWLKPSFLAATKMPAPG